MSITPFNICIPQHTIERLQQKLALTDFPTENGDLDESWRRGVPLSEIKRLITYWRTQFDWRRVERELNLLHHYTAQIRIEGFSIYDVHFVHHASDTANAIPLLFLHGWPGSFVEATKILPALVQGSGVDNPAFHVVAPSLIDFGFSSASCREDFNVDQHAEIYHKLMQELGYEEYVIQAGDVGHLIARVMAMKYGPRHCKAHHINSAAPAQPDPETQPELSAKVQSTPLTPVELSRLQRAALFSKEGLGYYKQQSTKPQTIGLSFRDSPVGLLGWIYEKLHDWADNYNWTEDEILTWVSIHYFSRAGPEATSNIYYAIEHREPNAFASAQAYIDVPLGITRLSNDIVLLPKLWNQSLGPVVFENEHEGGGHFAAWERPEALVSDLRRMFGRGGGAYGCVSGRSGYRDDQVAA